MNMINAWKKCYKKPTGKSAMILCDMFHSHLESACSKKMSVYTFGFIVFRSPSANKRRALNLCTPWMSVFLPHLLLKYHQHMLLNAFKLHSPFHLIYEKFKTLSDLCNVFITPAASCSFLAVYRLAQYPYGAYSWELSPSRQLMHMPEK